MPKSEVVIEKEGIASNEISMLEQARGILEEKVVDLQRQKESLEQQIGSLKYQLEQERKQSDIQTNLKREEMLKSIAKEKDKLSEKTRFLDDKDLLFRSREDEIVRQETDIASLRKKAQSFNEERMQIERMRASAEKLMEEAKQLKAAMENEYKERSTRMEAIKRKEADLKKREEAVVNEEGRLKILKDETERATGYYEKLKSDVKTQLEGGKVNV